MEVQKIINDTAQLVSAGKTEEALANLTAHLDSDPRYAELAQVARANQADFIRSKRRCSRASSTPTTRG